MGLRKLRRFVEIAGAVLGLLFGSICVAEGCGRSPAQAVFAGRSPILPGRPYKMQPCR